MEGERSPTLEEVVGGEREVSWPEAMAICSSSGDTFEWQSGDGTDAQSKESRVVVLRGAMILGFLPLLWVVSGSWGERLLCKWQFRASMQTANLRHRINIKRY
jgi:hypothetical protein